MLQHFVLRRSAAHDLPLSALRRAVRRVAARRRTRARAASFGAQEFRDLQMWSQLAWFDEEFQEHDPEVRELDRRAAATSRSPTSAAWARSSARSSARCCPSIRSSQRTGQIEISTTPVLPPDPAAALRFQHRRRLASRRAAAAAIPLSAGCAPAAGDWRANTSSRHFGVAPVGLWPSEGSVSDEVFTIAAELGLRMGGHR